MTQRSCTECRTGESGLFLVFLWAPTVTIRRSFRWCPLARVNPGKTTVVASPGSWLGVARSLDHLSHMRSPLPQWSAVSSGHQLAAEVPEQTLLYRELASPLSRMCSGKLSGPRLPFASSGSDGDRGPSARGGAKNGDKRQRRGCQGREVTAANVCRLRACTVMGKAWAMSQAKLTDEHPGEPGENTAEGHLPDPVFDAVLAHALVGAGLGRRALVVVEVARE